jgi:hypothetical protein
VYLSSRSGGERLSFEALEGLRDAGPDVFLDDVFRISWGKRLHVVTQAG